MSENDLFSAETKARLDMRLKIAHLFLDEDDRPRAERIRDAMDVLGLTQAQLAHHTGIPRQRINMAINSDLYLNRIEHAIREITHEELPCT